MHRSLLLLPLVLLPAQVAAQATAKPPTAINAIREADLRRDLYNLASDNMRGREAGTIDEMRASVWVADEMEKIGLRPSGDFGSWFQWWNMRRTRVANGTSSVYWAGKPLALWTDVTPTNNAYSDVSGPSIFVADVNDTISGSASVSNP